MGYYFRQETLEEQLLKGLAVPEAEVLGSDFGLQDLVLEEVRLEVALVTSSEACQHLGQAPEVVP